MLFPTSGCRFFIADQPGADALSVSAEAWVEIGETEALGMLGVEWDTEDVTHMGSRAGGDGGAIEAVVKTVMRKPPMQIILGNDPLDPGQSILWRASRSRQDFPFRLVFPNAGTSRSWSAFVLSLSEVFDTANAVMRLQADLKPTSAISRSEEM